MNSMNLSNIDRIRNHLRSTLHPLASSLALGTWLAAGTALAAPANDDFASAIDLTGAGVDQTGGPTAGSQTGTINVDASLEASEPTGHGMTKTVWFKWTSPADGNLTVSTLGSTKATPGEWDAVLGIYTGAAVNALTALGGSPQDIVLQEAMTVAVTAGVTYSIQLGGYGDEEAANILLNWNLAPHPADMLTFGPGATIGPVVANAAAITWSVFPGSPLSPTFTLSPGATCTIAGSPVVSGSPVDFSGGPVVFTITAQGASPIINDYTVTVVDAPPWTYSPWTGDANSGITSASPYTVAVNCNGAAVSVNGVAFQASATSGANFSIGGGVANWGPGGSPNVSGNSLTLANSFIYNGNPRTVTLTNLTPGVIYETSLFAFGFDASPTSRNQTFASGDDSLLIDQNFYGQNQGIRIAYTFVADTDSKLLTITPSTGTFHMSALANRQVSAAAPQAEITSFGPGATIGPVVASVANILWAVPSGSDLTALATTFTLSSGATCTVDGIPAVSGETRNFTAPVHYIVKASDFATSGTTTDYTVTVRFANALNWNVAGGGDWDLATTANWVLPDTTPTTFANNDSAIFNKTEGGTINIVSAVLPAATTVGAASGDYTFSGAPLAGTGSLTMDGLGMLTLNSPNTYSGATVVNAGTLKANGSSAIGGSTSFTVADGATLLLSGTGPWPANAAPLTGAGAVSMPLGGQTNVGLNFNMSAFTGILNLSGGMVAANPFYSPGFVSPVNGTINVGNNTTLYLGWQGTTFTTTVKLSGGTDNGEGLGVLRGDSATLNGAVILATNSTIGSAGGTITLNAVIGDEGNGFGFTTAGSGTVILTAANTYTGPTTIKSGMTLQCNTPNSLGGGALSINGNANLNYAGTKTVASLTLGGVVKASGVYGSSASPAPLANQDDARFVGTGTVTVDNSGFVDWSIANAAGQTPGQDYDNDGVENGLEYFMGQTGSSFTAMPGLDGTNTVTWTKDPAYEGTWQVQTSPNLDDWTNVAGTDNGTSVSYTLPTGLGTAFVRLLVTPTL